MQHVLYSTESDLTLKAAGTKEPILQTLAVMGLLSQRKLHQFKRI